MKRIIEALQQVEGVSAFRINHTSTRSYQLFWIHDGLETVRRTDTANTLVTVYNRHDDCMGSSNFAVNAAIDDAMLGAKIQQAVRQAALSTDKAFELVPQGTCDVCLEGNMDAWDEVELGAKVADVVLGCQTEDCRINALEIFVNRTSSRVINSNGLDKTQSYCTLQVEMIPTCNAPDQSVELYNNVVMSSWDEDALKARTIEALTDVRARSVAVRPHALTCTHILLRPQELATMLGEAVSELNYGAVYSHHNLHQLGFNWQEVGTGDALTITAKGRIEGSPSSRVFDADGCDLKDRLVLDKGQLVANYGGHRYAQYCEGQATGDLRCYEVAPGKGIDLPDCYLECVQWSGLQVDAYNDYVGGEVRLAYLVQGDTRTPVTGVFVSGKLSQALANIRLSKERCVEGGWLLPKRAMLDQMTIV